METYSLRAIQSMLGLSRAVITGLIDAGFVTPARGPRREWRFSFQDVVLLRTAHRLQAADIPARRIVRSLQRLKDSLPDELPLTGLRIAAVGKDIAVRDGDGQWDAESGQGLIDFEVRPATGGSVRVLGRDSAAHTARDPAGSASSHAPGSRPGAGALHEGQGPGIRSRGAPVDAAAAASLAFARGLAADDAGELGAAEAAYREAIRLAPGHADAYLNLGVLLGHAGRIDAAAAVARAGLSQRPDEPLLHFNLAVALEDLDRPHEALEAYEACLRLDPTQADAHYNAARLHEQLGHAARAIRHYKEYKRLQAGGS